MVYLLYCKEHKKQYVGESKRCFKVRLDEHLADIRHQRDKPVSNLYKTRHHVKKTPDYYILEHIVGDPEQCQTLRRQRERNWTYQLRLFTPVWFEYNGQVESYVSFIVFISPWPLALQI